MVVIQKISPLGYIAQINFLQVLHTTIVGIVCLVVHDEFVVHKVETV